MHYNHHLISLLKNLKCISRLNIHYCPNRWDKSYITSLKAVIVDKSLFSAGLHVDRILNFMIKYSKFTDNIGSGKFTDTFCQNTNKFQKSGGMPHPSSAKTHTHPTWHTPLDTQRLNKSSFKILLKKLDTLLTTEATIGGVLSKKLFLEISQNS